MDKRTERFEWDLSEGWLNGFEQGTELIYGVHGISEA